MTVVRKQIAEVDPNAPRERIDGHMNYAQIMAQLISPQNLTAVVGRGGGKSDGILAPHLHQCVKEMPRGSFVLLGISYIQILDRTLPAILNGLHRLGYERDRNYWVGRFPEKSLGLNLPYHCPLDPKHSMFIRDGQDLSVVRLVGQDRAGSANGLSVDAVLGDEVKFLNKRKLDEEVRPIKRGNKERFGKSPLHHGEWFTTDMPTGKEGKWIFDAEMQAAKPDQRQAAQYILDLQLAAYEGRISPEIAYQNIQQLRRGLTYYLEASSFVNVDVLGMQYFREQFRDLPPAKWNAQILTKRDIGTEEGFYAFLDRDIHCYDATEYSIVDKLWSGGGSFNDCRKDTDDDPDQPLTIAGDYGAWFNCLWVGQRFSRLHRANKSGVDEVRYLNHFYAPHPAQIQDVVNQFCDYYQHRPRKQVTFVFDHTTLGRTGTSKMTYKAEVINALRKRGWSVQEVFIGQTPGHEERYTAWGVALRQHDARFARQRFNRENTRVGTTAMLDAGTVEGRRGMEKDKSDERKRSVEQHLTTHLTDAVDTLFWWLTIRQNGGGDLRPLLASS